MKTQAPEMRPIKVKEPLELVGVDLIGENQICERCYQVVWLRFFFFKMVQVLGKQKREEIICTYIPTLTHTQTQKS